MVRKKFRFKGCDECRPERLHCPVRPRRFRFRQLLNARMAMRTVEKSEREVAIERVLLLTVLRNTVQVGSTELPGR